MEASDLNESSEKILLNHLPDVTISTVRKSGRKRNVIAWNEIINGKARKKSIDEPLNSPKYNENGAKSPLIQNIKQECPESPIANVQRNDTNSNHLPCTSTPILSSMSKNGQSRDKNDYVPSTPDSNIAVYEMLKNSPVIRITRIDKKIDNKQNEDITSIDQTQELKITKIEEIPNENLKEGKNQGRKTKSNEKQRDKNTKNKEHQNEKNLNIHKQNEKPTKNKRRSTNKKLIIDESQNEDIQFLNDKQENKTVPTSSKDEKTNKSTKGILVDKSTTPKNKSIMKEKVNKSAEKPNKKINLKKDKNGKNDKKLNEKIPNNINNLDEKITSIDIKSHECQNDNRMSQGENEKVLKDKQNINSQSPSKELKSPNKKLVDKDDILGTTPESIPPVKKRKVSKAVEKKQTPKKAEIKNKNDPNLKENICSPTPSKGKRKERSNDDQISTPKRKRTNKNVSDAQEHNSSISEEIDSSQPHTEQSENISSTPTSSHKKRVSFSENVVTKASKSKRIYKKSIVKQEPQEDILLPTCSNVPDDHFPEEKTSPAKLTTPVKVDPPTKRKSTPDSSTNSSKKKKTTNANKKKSPNSKDKEGKEKRKYSPRKEKKVKKRRIRVKTDEELLSNDLTSRNIFEAIAAGKSRISKRYSVTGKWYIACGYLNDFTKLMDLFSAKKDTRFQSFSEAWKEMDFSLIYRGRQSSKELMEFSEEIFLLTKRFLVSPHPDKRRLCALYTLYGLYFKHPLRYCFKIRIEMTKFKQLAQLVHASYFQMKNPDPAFIFLKLKNAGAFHATVTDMELCIEFHKEEREQDECAYRQQKLAYASTVTHALPPDYVDSTSNLFKKYYSVKCALSGSGNEPDRALNMVEELSGEKIRNILDDLKQDAWKELGLIKDANKMVCPIELSEIGKRRAAIMDKARLNTKLGSVESKTTNMQDALVCVTENKLSDISTEVSHEDVEFMNKQEPHMKPDIFTLRTRANRTSAYRPRVLQDLALALRKTHRKSEINISKPDPPKDSKNVPAAVISRLFTITKDNEGKPLLGTDKENENEIFISNGNKSDGTLKAIVSYKIKNEILSYNVNVHMSSIFWMECRYNRLLLQKLSENVKEKHSKVVSEKLDLEKHSSEVLFTHFENNDNASLTYVDVEEEVLFKVPVLDEIDYSKNIIDLKSEQKNKENKEENKERKDNTIIMNLTKTSKGKIYILNSKAPKKPVISTPFFTYGPNNLHVLLNKSKYNSYKISSSDIIPKKIKPIEPISNISMNQSNHSTEPENIVEVPELLPDQEVEVVSSTVRKLKHDWSDNEDEDVGGQDNNNIDQKIIVEENLDEIQHSYEFYDQPMEFGSDSSNHEIEDNEDNYGDWKNGIQNVSSQSTCVPNESSNYSVITDNTPVPTSNYIYSDRNYECVYNEDKSNIPLITKIDPYQITEGQVGQSNSASHINNYNCGIVQPSGGLSNIPTEGIPELSFVTVTNDGVEKFYPITYPITITNREFNQLNSTPNYVVPSNYAPSTPSNTLNNDITNEHNEMYIQNSYSYSEFLPGECNKNNDTIAPFSIDESTLNEVNESPREKNESFSAPSPDSKSNQIEISKPKNDTPRRTVCPMLFSKRYKPLAKLDNCKGEAIGTPENKSTPEAPRIKFMFKGLFKKKKK